MKTELGLKKQVCYRNCFLGTFDLFKLDLFIVLSYFSTALVDFFVFPIF